MLSLGLDSGSTVTKGVIFDGERIVSCQMCPTATNPRAALQTMYYAMYTDETAVTVTTGYGRNLLPEADFKITEITCHGAGAAFLLPACDAVIDVGGQDCKVITLDRDGCVTDFLMNDKCAAGTGRFLEMTMARVGSDITQLDLFVQNHTPLTINSMCTVFAESEIVGLLAQDKQPGDIVLGCVHSICKRTAIFAQKLISGNASVFFSGGLAQLESMQEVLGKYMEPAKVFTHPLAQYTGAIGAAVLGYKKQKRRLK